LTLEHAPRFIVISALADQVGLRADTVRYYGRVGLLPEPARSAAGYRLYDREDCPPGCCSFA
jgi:DNA-binding transcriptional MerR regulator